jgi:hypothetical protein
MLKHTWILIVPFAFLVYSTSFKDVRIIKEKHSVLGDADSANFLILMEDFQLSKKYGNEYNTKGRSLGDNAQKHKIHHVLYAIAASAIYNSISVIYDYFGIPPRHASNAVNAFFAVCNIFLLYVLLRYFGLDQPGQILLFLAFYAFSLSTWIFASIPESWTFSATLSLLFVVLHYIFQVNPFALSLFIGFAMLNNVFLASLIVFLVIHFLNTTELPSRFYRNIARAVVMIVSTWTGLLYALSVFDDSFRPDRFIGFLLWWKQVFAAVNPWHSPYSWKVTIAGLFFNSVLTNQSDPVVPPEALLYTIKGSVLGSISLLIYTILSLVVLWNIANMIREKLRSREGLLNLLKGKEMHFIVYCATWGGLTVLMYPRSGFLYSTMIMPLIILLIYRFTNMELRFHRAIIYATVAAVLVNNWSQVMRFREVLLANG